MTTSLIAEQGLAQDLIASEPNGADLGTDLPELQRRAAGAALIAAAAAALAACGGAGSDVASGSPLASSASASGLSGSGATTGATSGATAAQSTSGVTNAANASISTPTSTPTNASTNVLTNGSTNVSVKVSTAVSAPIDLPGASRLLAQTTFGASRAEIARTQQLGVDAWLDEQFAMPLGTTHVQWLKSKGHDNATLIFNSTAFDYTVWRAFLSSPDQLRQRVVYALSQILVVSINGVNSAWTPFSVGNYLDVMGANAFGNFRTLLEQITLTPAMGDYLNMRGNRKADSSGRLPDENYARELMQLFTIGLTELNPDGTPRLVGGQPQDTYDLDDVTGLARLLTGWEYAVGYDGAPEQYIAPMFCYPARHETGASSFLTVNVPAGNDGPGALKQVLDGLFAHPNVGPFIGRQLIQRLVTSNPSPAYVGRVAAAFANNGAGVRGDMKALIRAVLTDVEARTVQTEPQAGKLVEPVLRFTQFARAFGVNSPSGDWKLGNLSDPATRLGQSPLHSPTVFNFFQPGFIPPNTALAPLGLVAPELQITSESSVAGYLNFMQTVINNIASIGSTDLAVDYSTLQSIAADANALAAEVELILAANRLGLTNRTLIRNALASMPITTAANLLDRVKAAILLTMATPEYLVLR
jgi:uncharacterized protein (DUF1800 family)